MTDSDASMEEAVTGRDFIDDMAEVQTDPESEASHDSNEIEDIGEDIGFDDSEASSVGTYDDGDSFIDDQVVEELLSGDEYDLDQAKTKPRKSRIIPQDSDTDSVEDLAGSSGVLQQPKKKKKKTRKKNNTSPAEIPTLSHSSTDVNKETLKRKSKTTAEKPATKKSKYEERRDVANDEDEQEESKARRKIRKKKKWKKSKEVGKNKVDEPNTSLSIVNEGLRRQEINRNMDAKPSTSKLKPPKVEAQTSPAAEVKTDSHPKDFKNQMLYGDTKRIKRVESSRRLGS